MTQLDLFPKPLPDFLVIAWVEIDIVMASLFRRGPLAGCRA